ncbi:MAG: hypothetical protein KGJ07_06720, partial [Patescibacteria group bacterium]|nr:hypothetical protein [Patescibacteria group bacterium]
IGDTNTGTVKIGIGSTAVDFSDTTSAPASLADNGQFVIGSNGVAGAASGRIWIKSGGTSFTFKSSTNSIADYSEYMQQEVPGDTEPGDILEMPQDGSGKVVKSSQAYDDNVIGAHTTAERGTSYNDLSYNAWDSTGSHDGDPNWANVGMVGQIYVKVNMQNGAVKAGDPVTTSSMPGVAMKATRPGRIIGWAEEAWDGTQTRDAAAPQQALPDGVGMILVYVHPTWYDNATQQANVTDYAINGILSYPNSTVTLSQSTSPTHTVTDDLGNLLTKTAAYADAVIGNLRVGSIESDTFTANNGQITTLNVSDLHSKGLTITDDNGLQTIKFDQSGNAYFAGEITADKIKANQIEGLNIIAGQISSLQSDVATMSATSTFTSTPSADLSMNNLSVLGLATVSADLRVKGNGLFEGVLSVIDTLRTSNLIVGSIADFFDNVVFHKDVTFTGRPTFNSDTAGFAVIHTGATQVDVSYTNTYDTMPVVTATMLTTDGATQSATAQNALQQTILSQGYTYVVTNQTTSGFSIILNKPATTDVSFSWTAISVTNPIHAQSTQSAPLLQTVSPTPIPAASITPTP